jgi:hypothetical protein
MSSFFNQVGSLGQSLGQTLGQTIGTSFQQSIQQATAAPEELRIGSHSVVVKERLAEGDDTLILSHFLYIATASDLCLLGGFGLIELVQEVHTQRELVLKRCNIERENMFDTVRKEVNILQRFGGPYMVKLLDNDVGNRGRSREALLLLEYYPGGHLLDRLNRRQGNPLPTESIYRIFGQILQGLRPFHECNPPIIHRDIKLENVLFGPVSSPNHCLLHHRH